MLQRLTNAFKEKDSGKNFKIICRNRTLYRDLHVPLHASSNHNGQFTDQKGIHGFWESRIPELLADKEWDFFIGKAEYIKIRLILYGNVYWKAAPLPILF